MSFIAVMRIRRIPAMQGMRGGNTTGSRHRMRNTMLAIQFFICLMFLGTSAILFQQKKTSNGSIYPTCPQEELERTYIVPVTSDDADYTEYFTSVFYNLHIYYGIRHLFSHHHRL